MRTRVTKRLIACTLAVMALALAVAVAPVAALAKQAGWQRSGSRWWYAYSDGTYARAGLKEIDGKTYYFDKSGWMATGWQKVGGKWYWFASSGAMKRSGWVAGTYYVGSDGAMLTSCKTPDGYWVGKDGRWVGKAGWKRSGSRWWYMNADGSYPANAFKKISGKWYLFDKGGWMLTGWQKHDGKWYYLASSGAMATSRWVSGKYYVGSDGAMLTSTWTPDGNWVDATGAYKRTWVKEQGHWEDEYGLELKAVKRWVVDKAAWDEEVYETYSVYVTSDGMEFLTSEEMAEYTKRKLIEEGINLSDGVVQRKRVVDTIHHEEEGHWEEGYVPEQIVVGQKWVVDAKGHWV